MGARNVQSWAGDAWGMARRQHGVVARAQLLDLGMSPKAIRHRLNTGRLYELHLGVYAVGRRQIDRYGQLMAAVLAAGPEARLSHRSAAELWEVRKPFEGRIELSVPAHRRPRCPDLKVHRRAGLRPPRFIEDIPVGDPVSVLIDLATCLSDEGVEDAVNEADHLKLVASDRLPALLEKHPRRAGRGRLREILAAQTFSRAQNKLERRFLAIARAVGLPKPRAQAHLSSYRVDFHWPQLGLVAETDSLTYHRTAADQAVDIRRDQAHARAGMRTLRFTHWQVFHQPAYVREVLADTARHLGADG
jgi:very-short-patch-repair endonuclease